MTFIFVKVLPQWALPEYYCTGMPLDVNPSICSVSLIFYIFYCVAEKKSNMKLRVIKDCLGFPSAFLRD
jgi:hypothetical protein